MTDKQPVIKSTTGASDHYDPNQPRAPKGSEEGGQWSPIPYEPGHSDQMVYDEMTPRQEEALFWYTGAGHHYINSKLRGTSSGIGASGTDLDADTKALDSLMNLWETPRDVTVWRGVGPSMGKKLDGLIIGDTFTDAGYVSTSFDKKVAQSDFSGTGGYLFEIKVPKGTPAITVEGAMSSINDRGRAGDDDMDGTDYFAERELILPRNSKFIVRGIRRTPRRTIITLYRSPTL